MRQQLEDKIIELSKKVPMGRHVLGDGYHAYARVECDEDYTRKGMTITRGRHVLCSVACGKILVLYDQFGKASATLLDIACALIGFMPQKIKKIPWQINGF